MKRAEVSQFLQKEEEFVLVTQEMVKIVCYRCLLFQRVFCVLG